MNTTTSLITTIATICIGAFSLVVAAAAFYGILVWFPARRKKQVDSLKVTGKQGEGTIIGLPNRRLGPRGGRSSVFTMVPIKLEIRVPGIETYIVDKIFTFPTSGLSLLEEGKGVAVWVDPKEPRNLDKITVHVE